MATTKAASRAPGPRAPPAYGTSTVLGKRSAPTSQASVHGSNPARHHSNCSRTDRTPGQGSGQLCGGLAASSITECCSPTGIPPATMGSPSYRGHIALRECCRYLVSTWRRWRGGLRSRTCARPAAGARRAGSPGSPGTPRPPGAGNQLRQSREPQAVARLVADPADLAAQDSVLVPEQQKLGVFGHLAPGQHRQAAQQAAYEQVGDRNDHPAMIPARRPAQAQSSNRAPQVRMSSTRLARRHSDRLVHLPVGHSRP